MRKLFLVVVFLFLSFPVLPNSFIPSENIDRITGKKSIQYRLIFNARQSDGTDWGCSESSKCEMTMGDDYIYLNGYSLLAADPTVVKDTKVRIRIGNNIYNGSCDYSKDGNGCYVSSKYLLVLNSFDIKKLIKEISKTKGYFAIEVTQDLKNKEHPSRKEIWYTTLE